MKICINLESIDLRLRKTNEAKFRLFDGKLKDNDYLFESIDEINNMQIFEELIYKGKKYSIEKKDPMGFEEMASNLQIVYYSYLEKGDPCHLPDMEQLRAIIYSGNDLLGNRVIMTVYGDFVLINSFLNIEEPYCVLRYEYLVGGNGYIGPSASRDEGYIKSLYVTALGFYKQFLISGRTNRFTDTFDSQSNIDMYKEEIVKQLDHIENSQEI